MRSALRPVEAILFDLGNTLVHWDDVDRKALFRCAAERTYQMWAGRQQRMPDFRRYYMHQWSAIYWGYFKQVVFRREMNAVRYLRRACRKLWLTAPEAFFQELIWQWYKPIADAATVEPCTHRLLEDLSRRGLKLAIVSNTFVPGYILDRHLGELDLLRFFPQRIYSCDTGYRKPDRRIFNQALARVGVGAEQALFVGDLYPTDVRGARRAGISAVWKRRPSDRPSRLQRRDGPAIGSLDELPGIIERLECAQLSSSPGGA